MQQCISSLLSNAIDTCFARSVNMTPRVTMIFNRIDVRISTRGAWRSTLFSIIRCFFVSSSHPKVAIARLQPDSWCKKSVQRPSKVLQLTRKKGETVWLQCDVSEHLRSSIEWRWNGRNVQETLFNNFLLTKEQSKSIALTRLELIDRHPRSDYHQHEYIVERPIHVFHWPSAHRFVFFGN